MSNEKKPSHATRKASAREVAWRVQRAAVAASAPPDGTNAIPTNAPLSSRGASRELGATPDKADEAAVVMPPASATPGKVVREHKFDKSSNIAAARLFENGELEVSFQNGASHRFGSFTVELFEKWIASPSAGQWFHQQVRMRTKAHPQLAQTPAAPAPKG